MSTKLAIILAAMSLPTASLPALAQDFSGIYGGVDLISDRFDAEDLSYGPGPVDANGLGVGVFAGYNWQSGNIVFGPELYLTSHSADGNDGAYFLPFSAKRSMGVKARLGYTIGNIMPYLSVGTVRTKVEADHTGGGMLAEDTAKGTSFSLGADWAVTDQTFLRVEIERTNYKDDFFSWSGDVHDYSLDRTSMSVGYAFRF
jgi:outer membrane immunogenic protein